MRQGNDVYWLLLSMLMLLFTKLCLVKSSSPSAECSVPPRQTVTALTPVYLDWHR